jgi:hypothetical protein
MDPDSEDHEPEDPDSEDHEPEDPDSEDYEPEDPEAVAERNEQLLGHWDQVIADMEATAEEYREDGWEVAEVHPGDVTVVDPDAEVDRWGLDLLVPSNEFETVEQWVVTEDSAFDSYEVFRAEVDGYVYAVVAMRDESDRRAILFPVHYDPGQAESTFRYARDEGTMYTHLHSLQPEPVVTFSQSDPSLFVPGTADE